LNRKTGVENWKTDVPGVALGGIRYVDGKIIFSNRTLYIFDASNGKKLIEYDSSNESKEYFDTYISDPTYDPLTKRIYFSDGYFLQCFQLSK
jgi:outer membrane protein assembly factor BamB